MLKLVNALDMKFDNVKNFYDSFEDKIYDLNCFAVTRISLGTANYINYIINYEKNLFYLIDDSNPNYIIGCGTVRDSIVYDCHDDLDIGNIGYSIRPIERKKGYGNVLLKLLLLECEKLGMSEACISCFKENVISKKIILKNKGKFEKEFLDTYSGKTGLKYWIKLSPNISSRAKRLIKIVSNSY